MKEGKAEKGKNYVYSLGEEIANATTHGPMAALALFLLPVAAIRAYLKGGVLDAVGVSLFVISVFLMFMASTLYHVMAVGTRHKFIFKILDHIFIYVAIAGTYTPVALCIIGGWQGILITILQWGMVLFGILYKSISRRSIPKVSLTIYLVMGWTIIFFMPILLAKAPTPLLLLISLGGVFYSAGAYFYAKKGVKYHHMVWHFFVNLGAISHFIGIVFFLR
ncbi:MAG: hemolysin III family protein [Clostridia bacterium]|nr:hemolysin III family protein [Clostridia bacterium]